jgi:enoyl-CoA hydratase/carnithine racemase
VQPVNSDTSKTVRDHLDIDSEPELIHVELVGFDDTKVRAAIVSLNRPETLNAMTLAMIQALGDVLERLDADTSVSCVLITGRGRAFSAGGDLKAYLDVQQDPEAWKFFMDEFVRVFGLIPSMSKPVVALVNGIAIAGGLELIVACDFAYAGRSAKIGDGHLRYGQMGGAGVLARLPRIVGPFRARELLFSSRLLDADEATQWGLVVRVVEDEHLLAEGLAFARTLADWSATGVKRMKHAINQGFDDHTGVRAAIQLEQDMATDYILTQPDSMEGLRAFSEKRKPKYPGR